MKILLLMTALIVSGCGASARTADFDKAKELCEKNGGVAYIWYQSLSYKIDVVCKNGADFSGIETREPK